MPSPSEFKFIDLFAGIGGFHHGLKKAGGNCVLTCEIDAECRKVYEKSLGADNRFVSNIRELTRHNPEDEGDLKSTADVSRAVPDHDLLTAGFPCQPFSKSGKQEGFKDKTRGTLFLDICQILEAKKPKFVFLENVRNIAGPRHRDTWKTIISSLDALGYNVHSEPLIFSPHLLPPENGGSPQVRDRVLILGIRNDLSSNAIEKIVELEKACRRKEIWNPDQWDIRKYLLPDKDIPGVKRYHISEDEQTYVDAWDYFTRNFPSAQLPGFPIWAFAFRESPDIKESTPDWEEAILKKNSAFFVAHKKFINKWRRMKWGRNKLTVEDFPFSRKKFEWQAKKAHPTRQNRTLHDLVLQFRPSGIRVKPPTYLPALVAITQTSVIGPRLRGKRSKFFRKLSPVEAARLQGIPDEVYQDGVVDDKVAYKQLGNAVNAGLIHTIAALLLDRQVSRQFPDKSISSRIRGNQEISQTQLFGH